MFRIKDWDVLFENSESRKLKHTRYVCVPNKQDGKGMRRLDQHPRKVELFCAWNLILQVASKCPTRGVLIDGDGPMTPADLALKTTYPEAIFALAYEFFSEGGKLAWLQPIEGRSGWTPGNPPESRDVPGGSGKPREIPPGRESEQETRSPGDSPGTSRDFRIEGKGIEGKGTFKSAGENSEEPTPKAEFWGGLCDLFGNPTSHREELKRYEHCREFRSKGATMDEVRRRAAAYREKWPEMAFTANALLTNWDLFKPKAKPERKPYFTAESAKARA